MTPWYLPVARAVPALVVAGIVTFSSDHSTPFGYLVFGAWAAAAGLLLGIIALRAAQPGVVRGIQLTQAAVTLLAGVAALAAPGAGLPFFVFLVTATAAITGFLELYLGLRSRGRDSSARDWLFVGGLTALLAIVVLLVPPDFAQAFTGPDGVARELTASIIVVGVLGAYWAIMGVYLVIAGLSLKWAPAANNSTTTSPNATSEV